MSTQAPNTATTTKKVVFVGHCGPDSTYLRMAVRKSLGQADVLMAGCPAELDDALKTAHVDLILFNRELGYGFQPDMGVEFIRVLKQRYPNIPMMLISNYPEAQSAALQAGAVAGFGKREIGSPRVSELIKAAVENKS
jgi:DNA-binding NarL/FixJ family response regulator